MPTFKVRISLPGIAESAPVDEMRDFRNVEEMQQFYSELHAKIEQFDIIGGEPATSNVPNVPQTTHSETIKPDRYKYFTKFGKSLRYDKEGDILEHYDWVAIPSTDITEYGMLVEDSGEIKSIGADVKLFKKGWVQSDV